eukprot:jgi/Hompol1/3347/HPOL_006518-RA
MVQQACRLHPKTGAIVFNHLCRMHPKPARDVSLLHILLVAACGVGNSSTSMRLIHRLAKSLPVNTLHATIDWAVEHNPTAAQYLCSRLPTSVQPPLAGVIRSSNLDTLKLFVSMYPDCVGHTDFEMAISLHQNVILDFMMETSRLDKKMFDYLAERCHDDS